MLERWAGGAAAWPHTVYSAGARDCGPPCPSGSGNNGGRRHHLKPAWNQMNHIVFMLQENRSFDKLLRTTACILAGERDSPRNSSTVCQRALPTRVSTGLVPSALIICKLNALPT